MKFRSAPASSKALMLLAAAPVLALALPANAQPNAKPVDNTKPTLYMVGYAHLDTQWRWAYPQVVREYIPATMRDNFKLFDQYPDYIFNFSGSRRYEMMREYYPDDYQRLKGYIAKGQWFPCGSSVDEGDANVPSAESLVRQMLYGNHYFRREFGVASDEFMLPDCFGFPYALPTILEHGGIKGFSTQKLTWGSAVGIPFKVGKWIGPNGKGVVAAFDPGSYGGDVKEDMSRNESWLKRAQNNGAQSGAAVDYHYYGVGDRGGAPGSDSVSWLEKSVAGDGPLKIVSSRADQLFNDMKPGQIAKLPVYDGELLLTQHSAGSISSQAHMKRWNRKNELLADTAERASVAAMWLGGKAYPSKRLYDAWDLTLGSQMHDMLPGTSLPRAYDFCYNDELLALKQFGGVAQDAVGVVAAAMDTRAQGQSVVVYNPLSVLREDCVEANISLPAAMKGVQVYGPDGKAVLTQIVSRSGNAAKILFLAELAPNGFKTYDVRPNKAVARAASALKVSAQARQLENARFRVTLNEAGDIASIYDKTTKTEALKAPARLAFQHHDPSAFPAWNMDWDDAKLPPIGFVDGPAQIRVVENGPARVALEVTRNARGSKFVQTISLASGEAGNHVEVGNVIDWQSREVALKASFPMANGNPKATYDLQVGAIVRGNNDPKKYEVPQHQWFDLTGTDGKSGVGILNDCKFGSDKPDDDTVRLTLLYTPGVRGGYQDQAVQDFGRHEMVYGIAPHAGDWRDGDVPWQAKRLNQPLRAFAVAKHSGTLGKSFSLARLNTKQVEITAIKKAEDSDEIVVRFRELLGANADDVRLRMGSDIVSAREVDAQERPMNGAAAIENGVLKTSVPAFSLRAFALKLAPAPARVAPVQSAVVPLQYDADGISTRQNRGDGNFDGKGLTFAAEQIPATIVENGIEFQMGPTTDGANNMIIARGQTISLPAGYSRVHVLAAASTADVPAQFGVGAKKISATVENWSGFVGLWDTRLWGGEVPELTYNWNNPFVGLLPGYVKNGDVANYASHRHTPQGNTFYDYSYIFQKSFDLPQGARTLTLPNDPRIKIFAVSVARGERDAAPLSPLYDTLETHQFAPATAGPQMMTVATGGDSAINSVALDPATMPTVSPASGEFADTVVATINHPLYWDQSNLRYTLDGSTPTMKSPVYAGPIPIYASSTLKVTQFTPDGRSTGVSMAHFNINDKTAPRLVTALGDPTEPRITLRFSEPLDQASATVPANYQLGENLKAQSAKLSADRMGVTLTTNRPMGVEEIADLTVRGVKDASANGNAIVAAPVRVAGARLFDSGRTLDASEKTREVKLAGLPVKGNDPWTINLWCKPDRQPDDQTVIGGFGAADDRNAGQGRYICKFPNGLHFWGSNRDLDSTVQMDVGKWQMLSATYDGTDVRMYKNGQPIGKATLNLADDEAIVRIKPLDPWSKSKIFPGAVSDLTVWRTPLSDQKLSALFEAGIK